MSSKHVVVIGGGAIGTACAYYLRRHDCDVTLLEMDRQGQGGAGGNCGLLAYSHVLPLNVPGAVGKTLKALCGGNSPLRIKPRISPTLWMWLLRFAKRCNRRDMLASAHARAALIDSSATLYKELMAAESLDCEWENQGCLFVLKTEQGMKHFAEVERLLREEFDKHATWYDGSAVVDLEPSIRPGAVLGGWHYEQDAHARPDKLLSAWRGVLEREGVTIREHTRVTGIDRRGAAATASGSSSPARREGWWWSPRPSAMGRWPSASTAPWPQREAATRSISRRPSLWPSRRRRFTAKPPRVRWCW